MNSVEEEKLWYWSYEGHQLFIEYASEIRFRVQAVHFSNADRLTTTEEL